MKSKPLVEKINILKHPFACHNEAHAIVDDIPFYSNPEDAEADGKMISLDIADFVPGCRVCTMHYRRLKGREIENKIKEMYKSTLIEIATDPFIEMLREDRISFYIIAPNFKETQEGVSFFARRKSTRKVIYGTGLRNLDQGKCYRNVGFSLNVPFNIVSYEFNHAPRPSA